MESGLVKLQFQDDLLKKLLDGAVSADEAIPNLKGFQKRAALSAQKMDPVDLRVVLCPVGVDLGFLRHIENDAAGRKGS